MQLSDDCIVISISNLLKQTRPGFHLEPIILQSYSINVKLCIVSPIKQYLDRTQHLREGERFLISTLKPHEHGSKQTVGRWVKLIMLQAGISDAFKPHSTRSASVSHAYYKGVPLLDIEKSAGWANAATFAKYYNKPITSNINELQRSILSS